MCGASSRIRAEFRCPSRISDFTSTAGRQNKPFYEQNLSKSSKNTILVLVTVKINN